MLPRRRDIGRFSAATWFAAALLFGPTLTVAGERLAPGDHVVRLTHDGHERSALVHIPPQAAGGAPLAVVLSFHGAGGKAEQHRDWVGLERVADREGFVVVTPNGTGLFADRLLTWNAGPCCGWARRHGVDDVGFTVALLETLARSTAVDATRVYATGLSNGAMMAYRLAAERPERFAAIGPVAGVVPLIDPRPRLAVPVMHMHSVDDGRAPYAGGPGPLLPFVVRFQHHPVETVVGQWIVADECPAEGRADPIVREAATDHTATRVVHGPCRDGAEVVLWRLTGAGHVWPGGRPGYLPWLLGRSTSVIDANTELWAFFRRFRRAEAPALAP